MDQATVKVVLRVKPMEGDSHSDSVTVVDNGQTASVIVKKSPNSQELFQFDFLRALENVSQEEMYKKCGQEIVESVVQGYNGTILAYGQTGSGKTYTMLGPNDALSGNRMGQGIMPRAISQVFQELRSRDFLVWSVKLTFVEIYNETFRDLLMPNVKEVTIQDTNQKGICYITLRGVTRVEVQTEDQAMGCLLKGQRSRAVSAHSMNDRSSRSHTILTLWVDTTNKDGSTHHSKLNLVDLAGSERLRKTGAEGSVAKEATFINKSLSALSLVVKELKKKSAHVRYRDSKLTHYLKDSLGGNCQTLMIACMWGDSEHLGESISTCRFADDMQQVEVSAERNTGVEAIHGNLFKLDPVMQKYIDRITAKRVAEEKAKLMLELGKKNRAADALEDSAGEHGELEELRARVKEFELQKVPKSKHGNYEAQGDVKEIEALRQRVVELETERDRVLQGTGTGPIGQYSEAELLMREEMDTLRERVEDLQRVHFLSARDVEELTALRDRVQAMDVKDNEEAPASHPIKSHDTEGPLFSSARSKENLRGNPPASCSENSGEVERLRNRVRELEAKDVAGDSHGLKLQETTSEVDFMEQASTHPGEKLRQVKTELRSMRDRLKVLHKRAVETLTKEHCDEIQKIKDRMIILRVEETKLREKVLHAQKFGASSSQSDFVTISAPSRVAYSTQSVTSPKNRADVTSAEMIEYLRAENERMRRALSGRSQSPTPTQSHRLDACRCPSPVSPGMTHMSAPPRFIQTCGSFPESPESGMVDHLTMSPDASKHRGGLKKALSARFNKMMGRRKEDQFEDDFVSSENEEVPNIVILNSLTHDQLMELLRAHHETSDAGTEYDEDPNNLVYGIEPATSPTQDIVPAVPLSPSRSDPAHSGSSQTSPRRHRSRSPKPRNALDDMQGRTERPHIVPPLMLNRLP